MPIGALSRLTTALDKLAKRNALVTPNKRKMELYLTEFGYLTQGKRAQKPKVRAQWLHDAFNVARRNPRVRQLLQYQLVDPPSDEIWHSAILDRNGRPLGDLRGPRQGLRRQPLRRPRAGPRAAAHRKRHGRIRSRRRRHRRREPVKTRAAMLWDTGRDWEIVELDLDEPKQGEVLIRWVAAGLCHSDEHLRHGDIVPALPDRRRP